MHDPLHPVIWIAFFATLVCALLAAGYRRVGRTSIAVAYMLLGIALAIASLVATVLQASGHLIP